MRRTLRASALVVATVVMLGACGAPGSTGSPGPARTIGPVPPAAFATMPPAAFATMPPAAFATMPPAAFATMPPGASTAPPVMVTAPSPTVSCPAEQVVTEAPAVPASGDLTDSHVHELFDPANPAGTFSGRRFDPTARLMVANGVARATIFVTRGNEDREPSSGLEDPTLCFTQQALQRHPGRFVPLVLPRLLTATSFASIRADLERDDTPYRGVGELAFYRPEFDGWTLSEPASAAILDPVFQVLARKAMVLYLHLRDGQDADFAALMTRFPALKVVIHAYPSPNRDRLATWLRRYPSLSYSIDAPALFTLMPTSGRDEFLAGYDRQRDAALQQATIAWQPIVSEFPGRIMWGTDVGLAWQYDPDVYRRYVAFSRLFIATVSASARNAYTYGNAERVFGSPRP